MNITLEGIHQLGGRGGHGPVGVEGLGFLNPDDFFEDSPKPIRPLSQLAGFILKTRPQCTSRKPVKACAEAGSGGRGGPFGCLGWAGISRCPLFFILQASADPSQCRPAPPRKRGEAPRSGIAGDLRPVDAVQLGVAGEGLLVLHQDGADHG